MAWNVAQQYRAAVSPSHPLVVLSTASPYKFPVAVLTALGQTPPEDEFDAMERLRELTGVEIPKNLAGLRSKQAIHTDVIDRDDILPYVLDKVSRKNW